MEKYTGTSDRLLDSIVASRRAMLVGGSALAGLALVGMSKKPSKVEAATYTDFDILNFALNLEYLESNFYSLAAYGQLPASVNSQYTLTGSGTQGTVVTKNSKSYASCKVPFAMPAVAAYALEIAGQENLHVITIKAAIASLSGTSVAQPQIDLYNSFNFLGTKLGMTGFDPFASDANFLLGSYVFEDVGVTAYSGGAPFISNKTVLADAAAIHAVEAYHAGMIRQTLFSQDVNNGNTTYEGLTQKISALRASLDGTAGTAGVDDYGIQIQSDALPAGTQSGIAITDDNPVSGLEFSRTFAQVLSIVYATPVTTVPSGVKNGFFPAGMNGTIS